MAEVLGVLGASFPNRELSQASPDSKTVKDFLDSKFRSVDEIVTTTISSLQTYYNQFIDHLARIVAEMPDVGTTYDFQEMTLTSKLEGMRPDPLSGTELTMSLPTWPSTPALDDITLESLPAVPVFTGLEPNINIPNIPALTVPTPPSGRPSMSNIDIPSAPTLTLPDPPTIEEVTIKAPPDITLPSFSAILPTENLELLENTFSYGEPGYDSTLADALTVALISNLASGGTGLSADVEGAIFDRAVARRELEDERLYSEAENYFSSRGWRLPPGALAGRIAEALQEITRDNTDINEKITIEQARLADQNTRHIRETIVNWQNVVNSQFNAVADRMLKAAVDSVDAGTKVAQVQVLIFGAKLEKYKDMAAVYNSRLQGELLVLETYKSELEGKRLTADVQRLYVDAYVARLEGVRSLASLYNTQMEGAGLQLGLERAKIDGFRGEVEAYSAEVAARASVYTAYSAQIQGEVGKADIYARTVQAYSARVGAVGAETEMKIGKMRAQVEENNSKIEKSRNEVALYNAAVAKETARINSLVSVYGAKIEGYRADAQVEDTLLKAQTELHRRNIEQARNQAELILKETEMAIQEFLAVKGFIADYMKAIAASKTQIVASALAAFNTSAVMGYQASEGLQGSISYSYSSSFSNDRTSSVSTTYHYYPEG